MPQPGYQQGNERVLWWKVAMHLDEAQLSLTNAIAHTVDDPTAALAVQECLRTAQAILLDVFSAKGLLPRATNGAVEAQPPAPPGAAPMGPPPGVPMGPPPGVPPTVAPVMPDVTVVVDAGPAVSVVVHAEPDVLVDASSEAPPASADQEASVYEAAMEGTAPAAEPAEVEA